MILKSLKIVFIDFEKIQSQFFYLFLFVALINQKNGIIPNININKLPRFFVKKLCSKLFIY